MPATSSSTLYILICRVKLTRMTWQASSIRPIARHVLIQIVDPRLRSNMESHDVASIIRQALDAAAAWLERRSVQDRLPFHRFINCTRHAPPEGSDVSKPREENIGLEAIDLEPLAAHLDDVAGGSLRTSTSPTVNRVSNSQFLSEVLPP